MFPSHKACLYESANTILGRQFGITNKMSGKKLIVQRVTNNEM